MIVYAKGQEDLAKTIGKLLENQFRQALPNATFCYEEAGKLGLSGLRVLPEILVRGNVTDPGLRRLLLNETLLGGFRPIVYDVDAMFATQVSLQFGLPRPRYGYNATLLVVNGTTPVTSIVNASAVKDNKRALAIFSAVYAANITSVKIVSPRELGAAADKLERLPNVLAESSVNLSKDTVNIVSLDGYYAIKGGASGFLVNIGAAEAWEKRGLPDLPGLKDHPSIGNGPVHIAVLEDFECPFCARFYNNTLPYLEKLAREGRVTIHFYDLLIHQNIIDLHAKLLCLYNKTGNATLYLEYAKRIYRALLEAQKARNFTLYQDALKRIEGEVDKMLGGENCGKAREVVLNETHRFLAMGLRGTPTFILWRDGGDKAIYAVGYRDKTFFEKAIKSLEESG